jgi:hypothetical protein
MASSEFVLNVAVGNLAEEGGIYSCNSLNRYGTATETTTLNVRIGVKCKPKSQTGRRGEAVYINCTVFGYPLPSQIYVTLPNGRNLSFPVSLRKSSFNHTLKVKISPSAEGGGLYVFRSKSTSGLAKAISSVLVPTQVEQPTIAGRSRVSYGESVTIICTVTGFPLPTNQMELLRNGALSPIQPVLNSSSRALTHSASIFKISTVSVDTAGEYRCRQTTSTMSLSSSHRVYVEVGPYFSQRILNFTAREGDPASLSCFAKGSPLPTVNWLKRTVTLSNVVVATDSKKFVVNATAYWKKSSRFDSNHYRCKASNGIGGTIFSDWAYLDVLYAPDIISNPVSVRLTSSTETSQKQSFQLRCRAKGHPVPMVEWYKMSFNESVESISAKPVSNNWEFVRTAAVTADSGKYRCKAWNKIGYSYSKEAEVYVEERPHEVLNVVIINVTSLNFTVRWQKPFDGYNTITSYSIHITNDCNERYGEKRTLNVNDVEETLLKNLMPFTCYSIDVQAFNSLGGSDRSRPVNVTTKPSAPGPVENISVSVLSPTQLNVTWKEPSQPNGIIFLYFVNYSKILDGDAEKRREDLKSSVVETSGKNTMKVVEGLRPYTKYSVSVTAVNKDEDLLLIGQSRHPVTARTLVAAPVKPGSPHLHTTITTQSTIAFVAPRVDDRNGPIRSQAVFTTNN